MSQNIYYETLKYKKLYILYTFVYHMYSPLTMLAPALQYLLNQKSLLQMNQLKETLI